MICLTLFACGLLGLFSVCISLGLRRTPSPSLVNLSIHICTCANIQYVYIRIHNDTYPDYVRMYIIYIHTHVRVYVFVSYMCDHTRAACHTSQTENMCLIERSLWKALRAKRWHFVSHCKPLCYHSTGQQTPGIEDLTPGLLNHVNYCNHVSCKSTGSMLDTHGSIFPQWLLPKIDFSYSFLLKRL